MCYNKCCKKIVLMEEEYFKILVVGAVIMGEEDLEAFFVPFWLDVFSSCKVSHVLKKDSCHLNTFICDTA